MDFLSSFDPSALVMKVTLDIVGLTFPETNRQKHLKIGRNPKGNYIIWSNPSGFRCKLLISGRDSRKLMIKPMRNWSNDRSPATAILKKIIKIQCGCHVRAQFGGRIEWTPPSHPQLIGLRVYISAMTTNTGRWKLDDFFGCEVMRICDISTSTDR